MEYERIKGYEKDEFEIERVKVSDEQVINEIKEMFNIENIVSIQNEKVDKRDKMIAKIISEMQIEKRQLARILGVNDRTIFRAIQKQKKKCRT